MLDELLHASLAVAALTLLICVIWIELTDLPLAPLLFGEAIGVPSGIALLTLSAPRRHH